MASGRGSNAEKILRRASLDPQLEVSLLICDKKDANALTLAWNYGVKGHFIPVINKDKSAQETKILEVLKNAKVDWVLLAGYMRILSEDFIKALYNKEKGFSPLINIHPSLLPSFPGVNSYQNAFDYGVKVHGATIHLVTGELDAGPILLQESYKRVNEDTFLEFKNKGLENEHKLYQKFLDNLVKGSIKLVETSSKRMQAIFVNPDGSFGG